MKEPPHEYVCAICLEIMTDPVLLETGQTYDRHCIVNWLCYGGCNCPKTGQRLKHGSLVPNLAVKTLIQDWCNSNSLPLEKKNTGFVNPALLSGGCNLSTPSYSPGWMSGSFPLSDWMAWASNQQSLGVPIDWWQRAAWAAWAQYCGNYGQQPYVYPGAATPPVAMGQPQWQQNPSAPTTQEQSGGGLFGMMTCDELNTTPQQHTVPLSANAAGGGSNSGSPACLNGLPAWLQPVAGAAASGQPLAAAVVLPELSAIQSKVVLGRALLKALSALNVDINTGIAVFNRLKCSGLEDMLPAYAVLRDAWQRNNVSDARNVIACIANCR